MIKKIERIMQLSFIMFLGINVQQENSTYFTPHDVIKIEVKCMPMKREKPARLVNKNNPV